MIMEKVIRVEGLASTSCCQLGVPSPNSQHYICIYRNLFWNIYFMNTRFKVINSCLSRSQEAFAEQSLFVTHQEQEQQRHQQKQQVVPEAGVWRRPGPLENLTIASTTWSKLESEVELI